MTTKETAPEVRERRNVLFITADQWRGDSLSAVGHPFLATPALDALARRGVLFANHWANAAPCGPSRACLYTGTYQHHNRSVQNGTPLDARFDNVATLAREVGYDPVLFGYTDTSIDPRTVRPDDPRLYSYEGILPGFRAVIHDPWEQGSREWAAWLRHQGVEVPAHTHDMYLPIEDFPGADKHGSTWAPARFRAEHSETAFVVGGLIDWLDTYGDEPFFVHASLVRPHPPRRNPLGYHDLFDTEQVPEFVGAPTREDEAGLHPFNGLVMDMDEVRVPNEGERRQLRATYQGAQREVDDQLGRLFDYLEHRGLLDTTLIVFTSDHGEMGGDHWLLEKLGYWDQSFHIPLIVVDPSTKAAASRGTVVHSFTESVDVLPTICAWMGVHIPLQVDGWSLEPFLAGEGAPTHWRDVAHFEWNFSNAGNPAAENAFGLPMSQCSLAVARGTTTKFVQFATPSALFPPLLFDLADDPGQLHNLLGGSPTQATIGLALEQTEALLHWYMRDGERHLSGTLLTPDRGAVSVRDTWR
jgi:arylsulfatase A-like enzyme